MLNNISWASYWTVIGITLFLYYAAICLRYYYVEVKQILSGQSKLIFNKQISNDSTAISSQEDFFPAIDQFKEELKAILQAAGEKNLIKEELLYTLQLLFKKYSAIKDLSFKTAINDYILSEYPNYCSIHLDEEDLAELWLNR